MTILTGKGNARVLFVDDEPTLFSDSLDAQLTESIRAFLRHDNEPQAA